MPHTLLSKPLPYLRVFLNVQFQLQDDVSRHADPLVSTHVRQHFLDMPILLAEQLDKLEAVLEPLSLD